MRIISSAIRSLARDSVRRTSRFYPTPSENRVVYFDTTLRDGEQSPGCTLTVDEKITIAKQLSRLGVDICEAGFPIASEGDFEAVKTIAKEVGPLVEGRRSGKPMVICGLSRAREADIHRCYSAVKYAPLHRIHTFLATSDIHLQYKLMITREQCVQQAANAVRYARSLVKDVEFSPEDSGRSDPDFLCQVLSAVIEAGATTLNIPDTVGYNTPDQYFERMDYLIKNTKGGDKVTWSTHCHNDLGLATANTFSGIRAGARQVEVTMNGIGERAGNTSLEEIAMILHVHRQTLGFEDFLNRQQIYRTSQLVTAYTGMSVQANKAVVGANAFAHEAGIHQDGMLKHRETYEIMNPDTVGLGASSLVLGKHSGMNAFSSRLGEMGYNDIPTEQMREIFARFKLLADKKKTVTDNDLRCLLNDEINQPRDIWDLKSVQVSSGNNMHSTATCEVYRDGVQHIDAAIGAGPVDAIFQSLNRITGVNAVLLDFEIKAVSGGSDALGEVRVALGDGVATERDTATGDTRIVPTKYHGHGADVDILTAAAKAYANGINRILCARETAEGTAVTKTATPI